MADVGEEGAQPAQAAPPPAPLLPEVPETQTVVLLRAVKEAYQVTPGYAVPAFRHERELLVRSRAIGLNPIDWKSADFNFAIPELPYISGRELAGDVVRLHTGAARLRPGDRVLAIATDYRDLRKGAYQEYAVAWDFNTVRLPPHLSYEEGATLGVAFVAAALALGICMGVDFAAVADGPDLYHIVRQLPDLLPPDVRAECLSGIAKHERAQAGDWIAIWGGSATSANLTIQLARLAGLRVIAVVDKAKHGLRLSNHDVIRPDLLVDSHDPERAVAIIRSNVGGQLRFGLDTRGKDSAAFLARALTPNPVTGVDTPPATPPSSAAPVSAPPHPHLVGLAGLPKAADLPAGTQPHAVPFKLFHELPAIGEALSSWLERLLARRLLAPPEIIGIETGLASINAGLDRMRAGEISGGKLVVRVE